MTPLTLYSSTCCAREAYVAQGTAVFSRAEVLRTSKKTMGLSLRMADFSSAFAFAGVLQATSCTPVTAQASGAASQQTAKHAIQVSQRTRNGLEVRLEALRVLRAQLATDAWQGGGDVGVRGPVRVHARRVRASRRTSRAADDHGHLEVAAGGVVKHARVVGDLAEGEQQEAHVHALDDRAQARHGGADAHALRVARSRQKVRPQRRGVGGKGASRVRTMKLYSQMGVSSSRNSPYFLYRSYVTCFTGRRPRQRHA